VVMTRGLVAGLDSEAEFAFVMGHEIGHVAARHSAKQMTYGMLQQIGLGATGLALSGTQHADAALNIGAIGSSLLLLKYSRDDELDADRLGIQYMSKLGYDPHNAISSHRNLEKIANEYMQSVGKNTAERGFFEDILSTHPRTSVRIDELRNMIARLHPYHISGDGTGREKYQNMTAGIRKTNKVYLDYYDRAIREYQQNNLEKAWSLVSNAIERDDRQPPFHTLRGFILLKRKDFADANASFERALALDRNYQPAFRGLGALEYLRGNYSKGIEHLKKGLTLFPRDALSHYFLGMSYFRTKTYRSAIPHLKTFAGVQPGHPEIHGILGICYENTGDLTSAYNHYVMQVKVAPDNEMGKHASSRARTLKPALQRQDR
jgi:beta-barrel assembly-enhancing protease